MIGAAKAWAKRHWPALRLRTILFGVLLLTAAMPGGAAIGLRVYENTLVRQTEAELVAQGAALASAGSVLWPGAQNAPSDPTAMPRGEENRAAMPAPSCDSPSQHGTPTHVVQPYGGAEAPRPSARTIRP